MYVCMRLYVCIHVCIRTYVCMYVQVCMYVCIFMYVCMYEFVRALYQYTMLFNLFRVVNLTMSVMANAYMFAYTFDSPHIPDLTYRRLRMPVEGLRAMKHMCKFDFYPHSANHRLIYSFGGSHTYHTYIHTIDTYHTYIHTYIYIDTYTYIAHTYKHIHSKMHTYIHTYIHIFIHTYILTSMHTYLHIHRGRSYPAGYRMH